MVVSDHFYAHMAGEAQSSLYLHSRWGATFLCCYEYAWLDGYRVSWNPTKRVHLWKNRSSESNLIWSPLFVTYNNSSSSSTTVLPSEGSHPSYEWVQLRVDSSRFSLDKNVVRERPEQAPQSFYKIRLQVSLQSSSKYSPSYYIRLLTQKVASIAPMIRTFVTSCDSGGYCLVSASKRSA